MSEKDNKETLKYRMGRVKEGDSSRMDSQMMESIIISDAVPRRGDNQTPEEAVRKTHREREEN